MSHFDQLKAAFIREIDSHKAEIERGSFNWFSIRVTMQRGAPRATFQCEHEMLNDQPKVPTLGTNGEDWRDKWGNGR